MINYWPFYGNGNDLIGSSSLTIGQNISFAADRRKLSSALDLYFGYFQVPSGFYFNGNFSVAAWIFVRSPSYYGSLIDFMSSSTGDRVWISFFGGIGGVEPKINLFTFNNASVHSGFYSGLYELNTWIHLCVTFANGNGNIYFNGFLNTSGTTFIPNNVNRDMNFIGKNNIPNYSLLNAIIDDLRIYNRVLESNEIKNLMKI